MKKLLLAAVFSLAVMPGMAAADSVPPITSGLTKKECGACHMAFSARFLPAQSWSKIMSTLDDHFGEDASLDEFSRKWIESYLMDNAGRGSGAPLRITQLRWFLREHGGRKFTRQMREHRAKSAVNCGACHRRADRGKF